MCVEVGYSLLFWCRYECGWTGKLRGGGLGGWSVLIMYVRRCFVIECTCLVLSMSVNVDQFVSVWVTISDVYQH